MLGPPHLLDKEINGPYNTTIGDSHWTLDTGHWPTEFALLKLTFIRIFFMTCAFTLGVECATRWGLLGGLVACAAIYFIGFHLDKSLNS